MSEKNLESEESIFYTGYEVEVLTDNRNHSLKKLRTNFLVIAFMFLATDLLALWRTDSLSGISILYALVFPLLFVGLAFFSSKSPYVALGIAAVLFIAILAYHTYQLGAASLLSGWPWKFAVIYLLISGLRHAKEAEEARKQLEEFDGGAL